MRRADRLFRLVQTMRDGRLRRAADLAVAMEVSQRTIYRDIADLQAARVPIDGAAGVGYRMGTGYDLPPLAFTQAEITALALGARLVVGWGGVDMARAAASALSKIDSVLPRPDATREALARLAAPPVAMCERDRRHLDALDAAARDRRVVRLSYRRKDGTASQRRVHPLGQWFWGAKWTLVAWCELRDAFRMFRLDRIAGLEVLDEGFETGPERSLAAFVACVEEGEEAVLPPDPLG